MAMVVVHVPTFVSSLKLSIVNQEEQQDQFVSIGIRMAQQTQVCTSMIVSNAIKNLKLLQTKTIKTIMLLFMIHQLDKII